MTRAAVTSPTRKDHPGTYTCPACGHVELSAETKAKIAELSRGRKHTPEAREKISKANLLAWSTWRRDSGAAR